jgi:SAM-dependent methyltransferase
MSALPPELDLEYYRQNNADLASLSEAALTAHYATFGGKEGRASSSLARRVGFVRFVQEHPSILEIGPFTTPTLRGSNVKYFDLMDQGSLLERAARIGHPVTDVPHIDYVSPTGDLEVVKQTFDVVFSSHCIEHQPNLVQHLNSVARLLRPNGLYALVVPDKRFMFDHYVAESTIADVVEAHWEGRAVHRLASVIEHRAFVTHNDPVRHWVGDHGEPRNAHSVAPVLAAMREHDAAAGGYVDVHAWQFTPTNFRRIIEQIFDLGLSPLRVARVWETPRPEMEFCAILSKDASVADRPV